MFLTYISCIYTAEIKKSSESQETDYKEFAKKWFKYKVMHPQSLPKTAEYWLNQVLVLSKEEQVQIATMLYYKIKQLQTPNAQNLTQVGGQDVEEMYNEAENKCGTNIQAEDWEYVFCGIPTLMQNLFIVFMHDLAKEDPKVGFAQLYPLTHFELYNRVVITFNTEIKPKIFKYFYSRILDFLEDEIIPMGNDKGEAFPAIASDIGPHKMEE